MKHGDDSALCHPNARQSLHVSPPHGDMEEEVCVVLTSCLVVAFLNCRELASAKVPCWCQPRGNLLTAQHPVPWARLLTARTAVEN
jgi:hypothetical protein